MPPAALFKPERKANVDWIVQFIKFHQTKHPETMGAAEIEAFLSYLASERQVSASTQNQAFSAILFLYQKVMEIKLPPDPCSAGASTKVRKILDRI